MMTKNEALKMAYDVLKNIAENATSTHEDAWCGAEAEEVLPAIEEALAQPAQKIDWKDQYEYQKRRAEMWIAKYEKDLGPLEKVFPAAQPVDDIHALKQRIHELERELIGCKEIIAAQDAVLEAQAEYVGDLQDQIVELEGED